MLSSPIIDFLIRIKNAYAVGKKNLESPSSKAREAIADLLLKHGYIKSFKIKHPCFLEFSMIKPG